MRNIRYLAVAGIVMGAGALYWVQSTAGQVQPMPGPGTGIVTVNGEVDVRRVPPIDVGQRGEWRVSLANVADARIVNTPNVNIALPPFVRVGGRYDVTWPAGERETITVSQMAGGAWVRTSVETRSRWLNLTAARAIEEIP